jgi:adenine-specific DNA-methyltransferase
MAKKNSLSSVQIDSVKHKDKRINIPTEELRDFVAEEERNPQAMLYPRDPSLDPQLVWKGKDEDDQNPLAVPVVPVYIQEKIHPQAIIENVRAQAKKDEPQLSLFSDFNGIEFEDLIDFYRHEQKWTNRMILGDSLLVMNSLAEKEGLKGKVQTIYFDPPYGIKFGSNWQVSTRKRDVKDKHEDLTHQPEQIKAFRDTWKLGIHSYLAYLRDRLTVARELLTETGSVFVQISDENIHLVRLLLDEVFGSENYVRLITFAKTSGQTDNLLASVSDYLIWYAKNIEQVKYRQLFFDKTVGGQGGTAYRRLLLPDSTRRSLTEEEARNPNTLPTNSRIYRLDNLSSQRPAQGKDVKSFEFEGKNYSPSSGTFKTDRNGLSRLSIANRLEPSGKGNLYYVRFLDDFPAYPINDNWSDTVIAGFASNKQYVVETSAKVIERCLLMTTDPGDLVLDPTCGSGTTAYVAEQWGRRWITLDTSRVAMALARTRLMAAKFPYFLLSDSPEGVKKEFELTGKTLLGMKTEGDIRKGFVYKRVPHVTLKAIANNPEIKDGMSREQIDAAIAKNADVELLYDQPFEDNKRIRVTGPFTVESLSPHRVLSAADENQDGVVSEREALQQQDFVSMILENLRKAGVQNTRKGERLKFDGLETYAGTWIHAVGEYTEKDGTAKRAAICIGPESGTVGPDTVKEAAKEAVQGVGFDLLIVCGFAFDPHVGEEAKRYGKLTVLMAKMNPDLSMGEELLKKTGAANLFMVFGEPDIEMKKGKDGKVTVRIKGVDIYDPTTGQLRSSKTDDIAGWFIDTNYNGESFFVRHAYFTGADEPYDKLKRALRSEVNEEAWSALYSDTSTPFDPPKKGKIAVKVINHYGDEVMKVFAIN